MAAAAGLRPRPGTAPAPRLDAALILDAQSTQEARIGKLERTAVVRGRAVYAFRAWAAILSVLLVGVVVALAFMYVQQGSTIDYLQDRRATAEARQTDAELRAQRDEYLLCSLAAGMTDNPAVDAAADLLPCVAILAGPVPQSSPLPARP